MTCRKTRFLRTLLLLLVLSVAAAAPALFFLPKSKTLPSSGLEVHFIDVGQGDCSLLLCGGEAMLIDGGEPKMSDRVYSYLRSRGIDRLKYVAATHPDSDHCGGLAGALSYAACDYGLSNTAESEGRAFTSFRKLLEKHRAPLLVPSVGDRFLLGDAVVQVLGPAAYAENDNDNSLVIRVSYGSTAFLFTGDAEETEEQSLLNGGHELSSTVLKIAHHGSRHSTGEEFLNAVRPEAAVISCGSRNAYGHPSPEVLDRLRVSGTMLYRTDLQGTIIARSDGKHVAFAVEKNPDAPVYNIAAAGETTAPPVLASPAPAVQGEMHYVLNTNTKRIHYETCTSAAEMLEKNRSDYYGDPAPLLEQGYKPCGICMKNK